MACETRNAPREVYAKLTRRRRVAVLALAAATPILFALDVAVGPVRLPLGEVIAALAGQGGEAAVIVWDVRLPVALAAVLVGFSLGAAGALMQTVLDNPLASPYTLGVASAAAFGAAAAYALGLSLAPLVPMASATLNAFVAALGASMLVYALGRLRGFTAEALVLAGIAVNYAFHSLLALMEYVASEEALQAIVFWLFGSLYKATWEKLAALALVVGLAAPPALLRAWRLTALRLGDDVALSMGVEPGRERVMAFVAASLLTATAVSFHGVIGFVGLVAPHIARMLVGEDHRYLLPASMLSGAVLMLAADIASKSIVPGAVIPIGIVTSLTGIPFFLALVASTRRGR